MFKKIVTIISAMLMCLVSMLGCKSNENPYGDRTLIHVGIYEGGWGIEWLQDVADEFEKDYPEYKVIIDGDKKYYMGQLLGTIDAIQQDMYVAPVYLYDYISQNKLMDITDVMNTPLSEQIEGCDETGTIADKMWDDLDEFYKGYRGENKYYGIPFGGGIYSINYDIDLFNEKSLFIGRGTTAPSITWVNESAPRSLGQDGVEGTYDDGLPVTYNDFMALLDKMVAEQIIPFVWSSDYTRNFLYSMFASYEGKENFDLIKTMNGEYTFEGDSSPTTITPENAYLLQGMTGKKKALEFAYDIIHGGYMHEQSGSISMNFLAAQDTYLMSAELAKSGSQKRIAFLIDGGHWYNEASDTMREMADMSADYANRRFGIMPFPKFEGSPATKSTYFASSFYTAMFIRKNAREVEGCKKFLAYCSTDESIRTCNEVSGMVRTLNYDMPAETLERMPVYYQTMWGAYSSGQSDIVYHTSNNPYIYENEAFFESSWKWDAQTANGQVYSNPFVVFRDPNVTVQQYMDALKYTYSESYWASTILGRR